MIDGTAFVDGASHREVVREDSWTLHELKFLGAKDVRLEVHTPTDEDPYLAVSWEAAPNLGLGDFIKAVEGAFKQADEQGQELGGLACIIQAKNLSFEEFDFERDENVEDT